MIDDHGKKRIEAQAAAFLSEVFDDGDATEALAALYAAAQAMERELLTRGHVDLRYLVHIQMVGKRVGAGMNLIVDEDVVGNDDVH